MQLIVIPRNTNYHFDENRNLLSFAISNQLTKDVIFKGLRDSCVYNNSSDIVISIPEQWQVNLSNHNSKITYYDGTLPILFDKLADKWFVISNGRFITKTNSHFFKNLLKQEFPLGKNSTGKLDMDNELITITVDPELFSYREKIRTTSDDKVAGFRRIYRDSVLPTSPPTDWPHHMFIKFKVLKKILVDGALPAVFSEFARICESNIINWSCFRIGGTVLDLQTEQGLLYFLTSKLNSMKYHSHLIKGNGYIRKKNPHQWKISPNARILGEVLLGDNVNIGENTVIIGPAIIADKTKIAKGSTINKAIIGPGIYVPKGSILQNKIILDQNLQKRCIAGENKRTYTLLKSSNLTGNKFRRWSYFSYPGCIKRIADITTSLVMLVVFAPIFPVIILAIKLTSPGPVLFKHKRQGLYGKDFFCLKFRTMVYGAHKFQEALRIFNQADGPQFKVEDDPRVTVVGKFLRDTFLDEIPQFMNILLGQMSVVGPRPSPKAENSLCPYWHDARLSVRPGITGLWQISRTRQPYRDFQEWIYYDTQYIKNLSISLDLWICWQTAKKLVKNLIKQF